MKLFEKVNQTYDIIFSALSSIEVKDSKNFKTKVRKDPLEDYSIHDTPCLVVMKNSMLTPRYHSDQVLIRYPSSILLTVRAIDWATKSLSAADEETENIMDSYLDYLETLTETNSEFREKIKDIEIGQVNWDFDRKDGRWYSDLGVALIVSLF